MLRATFKSRSLGYPELAPLPLRRNEDMIGSGGSIASTLGTENTSFATGWPMRRPIAKSEKDWSIGFAKCITNESGAGAVENENGSDLIPGDEPDYAPLPADRIALYRAMLARAIGADGQPLRLEGLKELAWKMVTGRRREIRSEDDKLLGAGSLKALAKEGVRIVRSSGEVYEFRHDQMRAFLPALYLIEEQQGLSEL
jgi:hypothetical protein